MKIIKQSVYFESTPHEIFELLMDSKKHSLFSGSKASISREKNGKFTAYDGYIEGKNLEIVNDKKILQEWWGSDWEEGIYSRAEFKLDKKGKGCQLTFIQTQVPDSQSEAIKQGWIDYYWEPMKEYLKSKK